MAASGNFRRSCDSCYLSKLKCNHENPQCSRCKNFGLTCVYGPGRRPGRRRKHPADPASFFATAGVTEAHIPDSLEHGAPGTETFIVPASTSKDDQPLSQLNDPSFEGFSGVCMSFAYALGHVLSSVSSESEAFNDLMPFGLSLPLSPEMPVNVESEQFWNDCTSLSDWIVSFRCFLPFDNPNEQTSGDRKCVCFMGVMILQLQVERYAALTSMPIDVTLYFQRLLLWNMDCFRKCTHCQNTDTVLFILAKITNQLITAYRSILEGKEDMGARNCSERPREGVADTCGRITVKVGSTTLGKAAVRSFLYSIIDDKMEHAQYVGISVTSSHSAGSSTTNIRNGLRVNSSCNVNTRVVDCIDHPRCSATSAEEHTMTVGEHIAYLTVSRE